MDGAEPLLTICIPTYNRGDRVYSLVLYLLEHIVPRHRSDVELLVVNNCSTDETLSLLSPLVARGVTLINREEHLPSAEANMFASVEFCRGRYIWFHGDDDIPIPRTVEWLLEALVSDDVDLLISNGISIDIDGATIVDRVLKMNASHIDVIGGDIVFACGFLNVLAGISGVVFRRSMADMTAAREISGLQEIYAHVAWLIHCFSRARVRILARPLVYYRTDDPIKTLKHFKRYAKRNGIGDHYVWSFGLIKLLNYLLDSGDLSADEIGRIYDGRRDGTRFRFIDQIVHSIYEQTLDGIKDKNPRNRVSREALKGAKDFLYRVDLFSFDTMVILDKLVDEQCRTDSNRFLRRLRTHSLSKEFERVYFAQLSDNFYRSIAVGRLMNYRIYRTPVGFVALADAVHDRRESILSHIDPVEEYPDVVTSAQLETVQHIIIEIVEQQQLMSREESGNPVTPIAEIANSMRRISDDVHASVHTADLLARLRTTEVEISRQSTYVFRLLSYRLLLAPLRRGLIFLRNHWKRMR